MLRPLTPINAAQKCISALSNAGYLTYFDFIQFPSSILSYSAKTNIINGTQGSFNNSAGYVWQTGLGFVPLGTTGYIDTGFNPAGAGLNYTKNDCHLGIYCRNTTTVNSVDIGCYNGTATGTWLSARYGNGHTFSRLNADTSADHGIIITDTRGYITAERTSSSSQEKIYKNGSLLATTSNASTAIPNFNLWAGALNNNGSILLPSTKTLGILTAGKSGVNNATVLGIFDQYFKDINYPVKTTYFYGDSLTLGTNSNNAFTTWNNNLSVSMHWDRVTVGISGQTVTLNTDNAFNPANLPTYNATYDEYLFMAWGVNDCWKTHGAGVNPTVSNFQTDYGACIDTAINTKGWPASRIILLTGYYVQDWTTTNPTYSTAANYATYVAGTASLAVTKGVRCINISGTTYSLAADNVHFANDAANAVVSTAIYNVF